MEEPITMEGVLRDGILNGSARRVQHDRRRPAFSSGPVPATKRTKDMPGELAVKSNQIPTPDVEAGSDLTKYLPDDVLLALLFHYHTPDYVRKFSTLSKSLLQMSLPAMKEMCRRRWSTKADFKARWASATAKATGQLNNGTRAANNGKHRFWYRQYFHEESLVGIPMEELTRLSFSCEIRSHVPSSRPRMLSRSIKFNNAIAKYIQDNPNRTEKDEGRVEVSGQMVGHPDHCSNSWPNGQCDSVDWFRYQGGTVIKLGMPLLKPHPGRPHHNISLVFYVERDDSWVWTLTSDREIMRSVG